MTPQAIFIVEHNGLRFERSGDSMAVYVANARMYCDRITLPASTEAAFYNAIGAYTQQQQAA